MDKRYVKRIVVSIKGELVVGANSYTGNIENVSDKGVFINVASTDTAVDFVPGTTPELRFQLPSGETLNLKCEIRWLHTYKTDYGLTNSMGMEIMSPPAEYTEFIKTLHKIKTR